MASFQSSSCQSNDCFAFGFCGRVTAFGQVAIHETADGTTDLPRAEQTTSQRELRHSRAQNDGDTIVAPDREYTLWFSALLSFHFGRKLKPWCCLIAKSYACCGRSFEAWPSRWTFATRRNGSSHGLRPSLVEPVRTARARMMLEFSCVHGVYT